MVEHKNGLFIAAMGIPGCGKSAVFEALGKLYGNCSKVYLEPEESCEVTPWPEAVVNRDVFGYFGSITWFRSMRVPQLFHAVEDSNNGKIVFVDSYFDKLLFKYLECDGIEWFLPQDDVYYDLIYRMAKLDYENLPNADIVICFNISQDVWNTFLKRRNRNMDNELKFRNQCFSLQEPIINACKQYEFEYKKKVIFIEQEESSPVTMAKRIKEILEAKCEGVCKSFDFEG